MFSICHQILLMNLDICESKWFVWSIAVGLYNRHTSALWCVGIFAYLCRKIWIRSIYYQDLWGTILPNDSKQSAFHSFAVPSIRCTKYTPFRCDCIAQVFVWICVFVCMESTRLDNVQCSLTTTNVNYNWLCLVNWIAANSFGVSTVPEYLRCKINVTENE